MIACLVIHSFIESIRSINASIRVIRWLTIVVMALISDMLIGGLIGLVKGSMRAVLNGTR